jgi:hypothetical protein
MAAIAAAERDTAETAAALLRFADEAYAALAAREPDPIEEAERAAVFGGEEAVTRAPAGGSPGEAPEAAET